MTILERWKENLTTEDLIIFMRFGFGCKDCPAINKCEYCLEGNGKKLCLDYQKIADFLESE